MNNGITIVFATVVMLFLLSACTGKKKPMTDAITNRNLVPIMVTRDVSTYVSDSGVVRYKIITAEWKVFDRLDPSRWTFEKGIYLEKFDNKLSIEAVITADTAYYYDKQELWELRGNVHIENEQDEQFDTQLLFWDQKAKRVYSDQYIRIRQQKRVITGTGFTSNQELTNYTIKQTQGIFPIKETTDKSQHSTDKVCASEQLSEANGQQTTETIFEHADSTEHSNFNKVSGTQTTGTDNKHTRTPQLSPLSL